MTQKWSSTAGPIQTKRIAKALDALRARAFTSVEKHGVIGVREYAMERRRFGFGTGDERTAGTDAILTIYDRVGEEFGWSITRENAKGLATAISAALLEAEPHVPVEDKRTTPEQGAQASRQRAAHLAAHELEEAVKRAERDAAWAPILAKAGRADALIVAEQQRDASDPMTDYFANTTVRRVAIGVRYGRREDFRQLRSAAERFLRTIGEPATIAQLTEHRENYSMGRGNYISDHGWDGAGSGWTFRTWPLPLDAAYRLTVPEDMMPTPMTTGSAPLDAATGGAAPQITPSVIRAGYVEIRFAQRPDARVLAALKACRFRWARRSRCWYGPQADVPASLTRAGELPAAEGASDRTATAGEAP